VLFDKLDTAKMHGLDTSNVSSRVESRRDEPSVIWAIGYTTTATIAIKIIIIIMIIIMTSLDIGYLANNNSCYIIRP